MVTLLSVRMGAKPLSQAQQKVRGRHLYSLFLRTKVGYFLLEAEFCLRSEQLSCRPGAVVLLVLHNFGHA